MKTIKFNNYGMRNIDDLICKYDGKEATDAVVFEMKNEIYDSFINNPFVDFTTKGEGAHLVDLETMENCEILC